MWEYVVLESVGGKWSGEGPAPIELTATGPVGMFNQLGKDNWELVGVTTNPSEGGPVSTYYFKRPLADAASPPASDA